MVTVHGFIVYSRFADSFIPMQSDINLLASIGQSAEALLANINYYVNTPAFTLIDSEQSKYHSAE